MRSWPHHHLCRPLLALLLTACDGFSNAGPTATEHPGSGPPSTAGATADADEARAVTAFSAAFSRAIARCDALIGAVTPELAAARPFPFGSPELTSACGDAAASYDRADPELGGRSGATDALLTHVARVADDLAYVERSLSSAPTERANALHHAQDALRAARSGLGEWEEAAHGTYADVASAHEPEASARLRSEQAEVHRIRERLDRLCFNQSLDRPATVRTRMLRAFARSTRATLEVHERGWRADPGSAGQPGVNMLSALRVFLDTHDDLVARFATGRVTSSAERQEQVARIDAALAAYDAASAAHGAVPEAALPR